MRCARMSTLDAKRTLVVDLGRMKLTGDISPGPFMDRATQNPKYRRDGPSIATVGCCYAISLHIIPSTFHVTSAPRGACMRPATLAAKHSGSDLLDHPLKSRSEASNRRIRWPFVHAGARRFASPFRPICPGNFSQCACLSAASGLVGRSETGGTALSSGCRWKPEKPRPL